MNGLAGAEVGDDPDQLAAVARAPARAGVVAFCPTLVSRSAAAYRRPAAALAAASWPADGARPLGAHLEGPFLAPARAGAHDPAHLRAPAPEALDALLAAFRPALVTLAPELPGALAEVRRLARAGAVPACGHTDADHATGVAAIRAGARLLGRAPDPGDLVVLDPALRPRLTAIGGRVAWADEGLPFDAPEPGAPLA